MRRIFLIGLLAGCTASPLPEAPFEGDFEFMPGTGSLPFTTVAGVIEPDQRLRVWILNTMDPPATFSPAADGSVSGMLSPEANQVRLEIIDGDQRSEPLDLNVPEGTPIAETGCISVDTQLELEPFEAGRIRVQNACDAELEITLGRRAPSLINFPFEASAAAGQTIQIPVDVEGPTEEILFLVFEGAADERRAVTVFTR